MYSLIVTCKMNAVDPQAWLADVLSRIAEHPARRTPALALARSGNCRSGSLTVAALSAVFTIGYVAELW